ncbi:hypothetical protein Tco_1009131 [Tanacetum coccineum]
MMVYLKKMDNYKMKYFKGMSYDQIRPIFKEEYRKVQTLFKKDSEVRNGYPRKKRKINPKQTKPSTEWKSVEKPKSTKKSTQSKSKSTPKVNGQRRSLETDIREKDKKSIKNEQNRARNGKAWKSQVKVKVDKSQSQPQHSQQSKVKAETEEILNGLTRSQIEDLGTKKIEGPILLLIFLSHNKRTA